MTTLLAHATEDLPDPILSNVRKVAVEKRRRPLTILFGFAVATIVLTTGTHWSAAGGGRETLFVVGMMLAAVGAFGRIWSNLFISGYKSRELITTGPYSLCRNPLYFFSAIGMTGIGLTTETVSIPLVLIVFFAAYYPLIIDREEVRLLDRHGEAFADYCRVTPPFWPQFSLFTEPETYVIHPRAIRKNLADAFWFIAIAAIVHAEAHYASVIGIPTLFDLW